MQSILIIGNVTKDVYLRLDNRTNKFETDDKEIKAYAFSIIEDVFGTKNPVVNLQARIRKHFVG